MVKNDTDSTRSDTQRDRRKDLLDKPTLTVPEAGELIGVGRGVAYEAARRGQIPTIRIGNRLLVPTTRLLKMLEGDDGA